MNCNTMQTLFENNAPSYNNRAVVYLNNMFIQLLHLGKRKIL